MTEVDNENYVSLAKYPSDNNRTESGTREIFFFDTFGLSSQRKVMAALFRAPFGSNEITRWASWREAPRFYSALMRAVSLDSLRATVLR